MAATRALVFALAICGIIGVFGVTKVPLRCDDPAFPAHGAKPGHPGITVCDSTEACWVPVSNGREACFYVCGDKGKGEGRRGYICNQKPPLQVAWAPIIGSAMGDPFVEVNSGGVLSASSTLGGGIPHHPNGGTGLYAVRFQDPSGTSNSEVARATYTFAKASKTIERFYTFLFSDCQHSSANIRLLDSAGLVLGRVGFNEYLANVSASLFGVEVNGVFIASAQTSRWYSVEIDINFVKKQITSAKVAPYTGNVAGVETIKENLKIPFENVNAANLGKIELYQKYRPCTQVGWANFVTFDPKRAPYSETGTKYKPTFQRNLATVQDLENINNSTH